MRGAPSHKSLDALLVPSGLQTDLERTCEIVLRQGWPSIVWQRGFTGLHLAAKHGSEAAVRLLLHASAAPSLTQEDSRQLRPIDHARKKGHGAVLLELLDPKHASDLASGVMPVQAEAAISDVDIQRIRDVHQRQCKELEEAAYQRGRSEGRSKVEELRYAIAAERTAKQKALQEVAQAAAMEANSAKGQAGFSAQMAQLRSEMSKERADSQKRVEELQERITSVSRTLSSAFGERDAAKNRAVELEAKVRQQEQELTRLKSSPSFGAVGKTFDVPREPVKTTLLQYAPAPPTGTIPHGPRMSPVSVDLREEDSEALSPNFRTEQPTLLPSDAIDIGPSRNSEAFWESVLMFRPSEIVPPFDHLRVPDNSPPTAPEPPAVVFKPGGRATHKRASFDCEVGEEMPNVTVEMMGSPLAPKHEVDLTASIFK